MKIEDIDWNRLEHAYGRAEDVPELLRQLAGGDSSALDDIAGGLFHQRSVYSATAAAFPFLVDAATGNALDSQDRATLIHSMSAASPDLPGGEDEPWVAELDQAFRAGFPRLMAMFGGGDAPLRAALALLAASAPSLAVAYLDEIRAAGEGADEPLATLIALAVAVIEGADDAALAELISRACEVEPEAEEMLEEGGEPRDDALSVLELLAQLVITA